MIQGLAQTPGVDPGMNPQMTGQGLVDHLDQVLSNAHPAAQEALARSGLVPAVASSPAAAAAAPVSPIATPGPAVRGLADPVMARDQNELTRLDAPGRTMVTDASGNQVKDPLAHTQADTGRSGIGQIHNPWARHALQIAEAIGGGFAPGIDMMLPGTQLHHDLLVKQQQGIVGGDQQRANEETQRQHLEAEIPELGARTANENAEAQTRLHPVAKAPTNPFEAWWGQNKDNPNVKPEDWLKTEEGAKFHEPNEYADFKASYMQQHPDAKPEDMLKAFSESKASAQKTPQNEYEDFKTGYTQSHPGAKLEEVARAYAEAHKPPPNPQNPPQALMIGPDGKAILVRPGTMVPTGSQTAAGVNAESTPTTQMRNVGAQATLVHEQTPMMLSEIDRLKDKLGPVAGRWNDFMQGKVGMNDPDFAGLRSDLLMYSSAVALMHARGRLPENLREEFDRTINNPTQDFGNLKAVIQHIDQWTSQNMNAMRGQNGAAPSGGPATPSAGSYTAGKSYGGMTFKGGDPNDQKNWEKKK